MSMHAAGLRPGLTSRPLALPALLGAGGGLLGALYASTAEGLSPWTLPALLSLATVVGLSYRQPEIGLAVTLAIIPAATFGFDQRIVAYLVSGLSVYLALIGYRRRRRRDGRVAVPTAGVLLVLYLAAAMISVTQTNDLSSASHLTRSLLTGSLLFAATFLCVHDRRSLMWVLGGLSVGALLVGVHASWAYATGSTGTAGFITNSGEVVGRVSAGFSQPNQLGGFLVLLAPLALASGLLVRRGRSVFLTAALVAAIGVYASFSRGALIGLALVPLVFLRGWRLWLLGPLVAIVALVAAPGLLKERFATLTTSGPDVSTRTDIWRAAIDIWEQHPAIGVGLGGFPAAYGQARIPGKLFLPGSTFQPPPHAHNVFLQLLAEEGVAGALTFVILLLASVRSALRLRAGPGRWERVLGCGLLAALGAFLAHNMFDVTLEDPQTGPYVLVLLGLIAACGVLYGRPASILERA